MEPSARVSCTILMKSMIYQCQETSTTMEDPRAFRFDTNAGVGVCRLESVQILALVIKICLNVDLGDLSGLACSMGKGESIEMKNK
jgi:hypothetical protein